MNINVNQALGLNTILKKPKLQLSNNFEFVEEWI